jgi:hypothetical protein
MHRPASERRQMRTRRQQAAPHEPLGDGLASLVDRPGAMGAFFEHLVPGHAGFDYEPIAQPNLNL